MPYSATTRTVTCVMVAMAIVVQSFVVADGNPCCCGTPTLNCGVESSTFCCASKARSVNNCCCSAPKCPHCKQTSQQTCHCGCSDRQSDMPVPLEESRNGDIRTLISSCQCLSVEGMALEPPAFATIASSVALPRTAVRTQVLNCVWIT